MLGDCELFDVSISKTFKLNAKIVVKVLIYEDQKFPKLSLSTRTSNYFNKNENDL